jgi:hypothetical protein
MSKELEKALNIIKHIKKSDEYKNGFLVNVGISEIDLFEKLLTPPTAEEVCEALGEFLGYEVEYARTKYREQEFKYKNSIIPIVIKGNNNTYKIRFGVPPHLITLIGRFYEGIENNGNT